MDLEERFENLPAPVPVRARKEAQWDELEAELVRLTPAEVIDEEIRYVSSVSCLFPSLPCFSLPCMWQTRAISLRPLRVGFVCMSNYLDTNAAKACMLA